LRIDLIQASLCDAGLNETMVRGLNSLCENSEWVILKSEKVVQIILTENKNAPD